MRVTLRASRKPGEVSTVVKLSRVNWKSNSRVLRLRRRRLWNEMTIVHRMGTTTITRTTIRVGDSSVSPARASCWARVGPRRLGCLALRSAPPPVPSPGPSSAPTTGPSRMGLSSPPRSSLLDRLGDLLDVGLGLLGRRVRAQLPGDLRGQRLGDGQLGKLGPDELALALLEAPAVHGVGALGQGRQHLLGVEVGQRGLGVDPGVELLPGVD